MTVAQIKAKLAEQIGFQPTLKGVLGMLVGNILEETVVEDIFSGIAQYCGIPAYYADFLIGEQLGELSALGRFLTGAKATAALFVDFTAVPRQNRFSLVAVYRAVSLSRQQAKSTYLTPLIRGAEGMTAFNGLLTSRQWQPIAKTAVDRWQIGRASCRERV